MTRLSPAVRVDHRFSDHATVMVSYACDNCDLVSLARCEAHQSSLSNIDLDYWVETGAATLKWLPSKGVPKELVDVPDHIAAAASEAWECYSIGAFRGAVQLARSVVEASAKDRGYVKGRLVDKIDAMFDDRIVRPHIKDAAHEVRHLGNEMAHGDFIQSVSAEEAEETLGLMNEFLDDVFQSPARLHVVRRRDKPRRILKCRGW